jgi:cytochrome c peroxidase
MPSRNLPAFLLMFATVAITSCQDPTNMDPVTTKLDLPAQPFKYGSLASTNTVATLGRVLFYDKALSANNTVACASCHKQSLGFADNVKFSRGVVGGMTARNSMSIQNLNLQVAEVDPATGGSDPSYGAATTGTQSTDPDHTPGNLFWDGREKVLQVLVLRPIANPVEMGSDPERLANELMAMPYYRTLFKDAFGDERVTTDRMAMALSAFLSAIKTSHTRYDEYTLGVARGLSSANAFSSLEIEGMGLFQSEKYACDRCHQVQSTETKARFANIGLDQNYTDQGLADLTGNSDDNGKFKIPSLRNIEYTAPYMHDGRFSTLEEVIDHYSDGIINHPNLHSDLKDENGMAKVLNISEHEKAALVAFLRTLSDRSVISDPKFSDPFKTK